MRPVVRWSGDPQVAGVGHGIGRCEIDANEADDRADVGAGGVYAEAETDL
jgi:hypothetical protein